MLKAGERQSDVTRELNVFYNTIHRLWNHYQRDQNANRSHGSGSRRILTSSDDRCQLQCARCRRAMTERQMA
ncbi:hypothetical protein HNY73_001984 [Argiope bruennichi]|uniref:Uncharacterized protein n=1 Tax=Argiope bruennichi TaxID=94029 RepID=A0A8T0FUL3_ARGBR|nr:hypothetical protein HNY73_001984 [Argiope bruennichi]